MRKSFVLVVALVVTALVRPVSADEVVVRIATYNIKFLDAGTLGQDRKQRLQQVISQLDADVIGLEEIRDTAALRTIFPAADWQILIDEDSGDTQDPAIAVRKPLRIKGIAGATIDAEDAHFLFPDSADNEFFPNRRDVLFAEIEIPDTPETVTVFVVHAKSRLGGRATTDPRREGAAAELVRKLEQDFHEQNVIILGDFNDNPDDRSANILETGDPDAPGGPQATPGTFLVNLADELVAGDHVSHGRTNGNVVDERIETVDPGSGDLVSVARAN